MDGWKLQTALPAGMQLLAGSSLSASAYPQPCCPSQSDGQSLDSTYFLNRWEDTLAKVLEWCPYDLLELPEREPVCWLLLWPLSQGHMGLVCSGHRTNHWHRPVVTKVDSVQCSCTVHLWLSEELRSAILSQQMTMKEHADDSSFT